MLLTEISACQFATGRVGTASLTEPSLAVPRSNTWSSGKVSGRRVVIATTRTVFPVAITAVDVTPGYRANLAKPFRSSTFARPTLPDRGRRIKLPMLFPLRTHTGNRRRRTTIAVALTRPAPRSNRSLPPTSRPRGGKELPDQFEGLHHARISRINVPCSISSRFRPGISIRCESSPSKCRTVAWISVT